MASQGLRWCMLQVHSSISIRRLHWIRHCEVRVTLNLPGPQPASSEFSLSADCSRSHAQPSTSTADWRVEFKYTNLTRAWLQDRLRHCDVFGRLSGDAGGAGGGVLAHEAPPAPLSRHLLHGRPHVSARFSLPAGRLRGTCQQISQIPGQRAKRLQESSIVIFWMATLM